MFLGNIDHPGAYQSVVRNDAVLRALAWIREMPRDQEPGIFEIEGKDFYVNVHGYETLPREECRFESHRKYVDLQYCIAGGEFIDHAHLGSLEAETAYDEEGDVLFHHPNRDFTAISMKPGDFTLFWPEDVHRPKVADGQNPQVRKLVVKIALGLLE